VQAAPRARRYDWPAVLLRVFRTHLGVVDEVDCWDADERASCSTREDPHNDVRDRHLWIVNKIWNQQAKAIRKKKKKWKKWKKWI
jgi:hypothetical protein